MTPTDKIKFKDQAQTRALTFFASTDTKKRLDSEYYVEGYAARYEPYELYRDFDDEPVYERFERGCFDECDMSDIIYQYDHSGKVMARTSNGSLIVEPNEHGLFMAADLGRTEAARVHFTDDIKTGMITKMSWRFAPGECFYESETRTIVHTKVRKIYDVSAVSIPANDNTTINARALVDGEIDRAARSEAELEDRRRRLKVRILTKIGGI